ncbi:YdeI/OmpD-associated family protein [uncultured Tateyamaria sp.]|uniref:YdeI/OmpD-associated family protein n=1 Tax=uncultured Tateyamaria sp. TaxID=455651 RepID=UPI00262236E3|nr:YdeI/OmpD-associated family protein [uncultured Tateyamaria sp.]
MSDGWVYFDGVITPLEWGKNTCTIMRLPDDILDALPAGTRRIEGEFGDFPVNLALTKAPVLDGTFVYTGKAFLHDSGLEVGIPFEARLRPVDPDLVEVPDDVMAAVRGAGRVAEWAALSPGQQRGKLHLVNTAKRAETRTKRIATLIAEL